MDAEPPPSELLYGTTDPYEIPLIMPGWARSVPELAKHIDDGYELRRAADLPIDGTLPRAVRVPRLVGKDPLTYDPSRDIDPPRYVPGI